MTQAAQNADVILTSLEGALLAQNPDTAPVWVDDMATRLRDLRKRIHEVECPVHGARFQFDLTDVCVRACFLFKDVKTMIDTNCDFIRANTDVYYARLYPTIVALRGLAVVFNKVWEECPGILDEARDEALGLLSLQYAEYLQGAQSSEKLH